MCLYCKFTNALTNVKEVIHTVKCQWFVKNHEKLSANANIVLC